MRMHHNSFRALASRARQCFDHRECVSFIQLVQQHGLSYETALKLLELISGDEAQTMIDLCIVQVMRRQRKQRRSA